MKKRTGFTLVELLVVISIIGMLAGMLLPAVQSAREAGRRTTCINNQKQLVTAMTLYQSQKGKLPQFRTAQKMSAQDSDGNDDYYAYIGWAPQLFPFIEQEQPWNQLLNHKNGSGEPDAEDYMTQNKNLKISFLHCQSSGNIQDGENNYVVNCGYNDGLLYSVASNNYGLFDSNGNPSVLSDSSILVGVDKTKNNGMFLDGLAECDSLSIEDIKDGTTQTVLVSENLQAIDDSLPNGAGGIWGREEYAIGFCWPINTQSALNDSGDYLQTTKINKRDCKEGGNLGFQNLDCQSFLDNTLTVNYNAPLRLNQCYRAATFRSDRQWLTARPSASHAGIVVMGFADGSVRPVSEDVDPTTYIRIMTPNDEKCFANDASNIWGKALDLGNL